MNKNTTLTRTISTGTIGSSAKPFNAAEICDFSSSYRHSCAGMRALLWATSSARSLGSSFGSDCHSSKDNIFSNILTPGSIPQFTIPSLHHSQGDDGEKADKGFGSPEVDTVCLTLSVSSLSLTASSSNFVSSTERKAHRTISDPFIQKRSPLHRESSYTSPYLEPEDCPDPTTRAALSLPHLAKVTTPYGFVTLSQSPQMANEEALLFQAGLRRLHKDEDSVHHRTHAVHNKPNASRWPSTVQHLSREYSISQSEAAPKEEIQQTISPVSSSSSTTSQKHATGVKRKCRLWGVLRKHFTS